MSDYLMEIKDHQAASEMDLSQPMIRGQNQASNYQRVINKTGKILENIADTIGTISTYGSIPLAAISSAKLALDCYHTLQHPVVFWQGG